ncbi:MAG: efflux RND transporter periplasmic adaptor subunit [Gammaproteobacteria bacterium]|nr:efflux RND transporter periplasmic adaptor subunit [Gammaproteobacteria bacterium]
MDSNVQHNLNHQAYQLKPEGRQRLKWIGVIVAILAISAVIAGVLWREHHASVTQKWTDVQAIPTVSVIRPADNAAARNVVLPGNLQAYYEAPIYARVNGYLSHWYEDIGAHVKSGQTLADIDTPELDQQLEQAKADLASATSNAQLANVTSKRWQNLLKSDAVSQQDADEKSGDLSAKKSAVAAAQANVDRLQALESFKHIVSPFDGVVTARKTDVGALINAGTSGLELFSVADVHKLRLYVHVPQGFMASIKSGMTADIVVPEYPGETFKATLVGTSNAVSQTSGTLLTEFDLDNANNLLTPGDYAEVHLSLPSNSRIVRVPASALIFRQDGLEVAVVGKDNHVIMKKITIGQDNGVDVEVAAGLDLNDQVIDTPPDSIEQGDVVQIAKASDSVNGATHKDVSGASHE